MYSDDQLIEIRLDFLKENRPKQLKQLEGSGELDDHLRERADACVREAARLVETGITFDEQAWQWAIRDKLLESTWD